MVAEIQRLEDAARTAMGDYSFDQPRGAASQVTGSRIADTALRVAARVFGLRSRAEA